MSKNVVTLKSGSEDTGHCESGTIRYIMYASCLVLQNNQQSSSWSITLMVVVVGHSMRTGAHLAS